MTLTSSGARGHVPTLLQMTGTGHRELEEQKKQESDQTVLITRKCLPKRLIVLVKPEKVDGHDKSIFPALRA